MGYFVRVESDVHLYVEDVNPNGSQTILFLHGWPFSHRQFEYQFNELAMRGHRCIGVDWRGFGRSDKPIDGYDYDRLADDIRAVIEVLQLNQITLVGHSTGGAIAIRYVARYQGDRISRLVLVNAAAPRGFTNETAQKLLTESLNDRPQMIRDVIDTFFFQYITKPFADFFFQIGLQAAGWSTAAIIRLLQKENLTEDLQAIRTPTLIIHGIHDRVIPFSQAKEMQNLIDHAQLAAFQYSGHGSFWEERNRFNQLLLRFSKQSLRMNRRR